MALSASFTLNAQNLHVVPSLPPTSSALSSDLRFSNQSQAGHRSLSSSSSPQSSNWILSLFFPQKPPNVERPINQNNTLLPQEFSSEDPINPNYETKSLNYAMSDETINLNYSSSKQRIESDDPNNSSFNYLSSESSQVLADIDQGAQKGARGPPKRVIFTPQKARELRKKLKDTYTFHDVMYHSAIANRLANLDN